MSWRRIEPPTRAEDALGGAKIGDLWVLRGIATAFGCVPGEDAPRWEVDFGDHTMAIGPKGVVVAGGLAVTLVEDGDYKCSVVALDPAKGRRKWRRSLPINPGADGIAALGDLVLVHGSDKSRTGQLYMLAAADGKVVHTTPTASANGVQVAGGRALIVARWGEGVFAVVPGKPPKRISRFAGSWSATHGDSLFVCAYRGSVVIELDARGRELGRVDAAVDRPSGVYPLPEPGRVLLLGRTCARVLDVRAGAIVSTLRLPRGTRPTFAAATRHGLVVSYQGKSVHSGKLAVFDPATGERKQALALAGTAFAEILAADDQFATGAGEFMHFFAWIEESR